MLDHMRCIVLLMASVRTKSQSSILCFRFFLSFSHPHSLLFGSVWFDSIHIYVNASTNITNLIFTLSRRFWILYFFILLLLFFLARSEQLSRSVRALVESNGKNLNVLYRHMKYTYTIYHRSGNICYSKFHRQWQSTRDASERASERVRWRKTFQMASNVTDWSKWKILDPDFNFYFCISFVSFASYFALWIAIRAPEIAGMRQNEK